MTMVKAENLFFKFSTNSKNQVRRPRAKEEVHNLRSKNNSKVISYKLTIIANEIAPAYEMDDGDLTEAQINLIRNAVPQEKMKSVKSSLIHKNPVE